MLTIDHATEPVISWRPGNQTRVHCAKRLGSRYLTSGEQWFDAGTGAPTHHHPDGIEEVISVVSGSMRVWVDGEEAIIRAGETVLLPALSHHGFMALEHLHIEGSLSSAVQTTIYDDEPDTILDIGDTEGVELDAHRRVRHTDAPERD